MAAELLDLSDDFGPFEGRTWLNCAHQGPMPRPAVAAAREAIQLKVAPHRLASSAPFTEVPARLRAALGRLIGVDADDVILGQGASYGLNVIANGVRWRDGDEVLVVRGDFPAAVFPWLPLREQGVRVRFVEPAGGALSAGELAAALTPATRLVCTTWVHSLTGWAVDAAALAAACRARGTLLVLNASQGIGCRPFAAAETGADAVVSVGFKWLCGPYATGFCWIRPALRDRMRPVQGYWLANLTADDLQGDFACEIRPDLGARAYDVTCPANFNNFIPWTRSLEYLLDVGVDRVAAHDQALVSRLIEGLDRDRYELLSPESGPARTTLVYLRHRRPGRTPEVFGSLRDAGIDVSLRRGRLRVSPHLYNTAGEIDRLLEVLDGEP